MKSFDFDFREPNVQNNRGFPNYSVAVLRRRARHQLTARRVPTISCARCFRARVRNCLRWANPVAPRHVAEEVGVRYLRRWQCVGRTGAARSEAAGLRNP